MSITRFFVDAFTSALDRGIASPHDLIRHATPEVLSLHLPRPLWARLLTACLGAARVDASTIVDTVGIANLCEHLPKPLLWTCLAEIAAAALGGATLAAAPARAATAPVAAAVPEVLLPPPPASAPVAAAASPPPAPSPRPGSAPGEQASSGAVDSAAALFDSNRARTATRPPSRGLGTSRIPSAAGASTRRPQAAAAPATPEANGGPMRDPITGRLIVPSPAVSRAPTPQPTPQPFRRDDLDFEIETDIRSDWKGKDAIPVDDEQLVDWSSNEETVSGASIDRTKR